MIRLFSYWYNFFKELIYAYKYRKAALSIKEELEKEGLRVDYLGRIYTVINLAPEMYNQPELMQQGYILQQLNPITQILMKHGMADSSFPDLRKIEDAEAYLIILYPESEHLEPSVIIINTLITSVVTAVIYVAVKLVPLAWVESTITAVRAALNL